TPSPACGGGLESGCPAVWLAHSLPRLRGRAGVGATAVPPACRPYPSAFQAAPIPTFPRKRGKGHGLPLLPRARGKGHGLSLPAAGEGAMTSVLPQTREDATAPAAQPRPSTPAINRASSGASASRSSLSNRPSACGGRSPGASPPVTNTNGI